MAGHTPKRRRTVGKTLAFSRTLRINAPLTLASLLSRDIIEDRPNYFGEAEVVEMFANGDIANGQAICRKVFGGMRVVSHRHSVTRDGTSADFFERAVQWTPETV